VELRINWPTIQTHCWASTSMGLESPPPPERNIPSRSAMGAHLQRFIAVERTITTNNS